MDDGQPFKYRDQSPGANEKITILLYKTLKGLSHKTKGQ